MAGRQVRDTSDYEWTGRCRVCGARLRLASRGDVFLPLVPEHDAAVRS